MPHHGMRHGTITARLSQLRVHPGTTVSSRVEVPQHTPLLLVQSLCDPDSAVQSCRNGAGSHDREEREEQGSRRPALPYRDITASPTKAPTSANRSSVESRKAPVSFARPRARAIRPSSTSAAPPRRTNQPPRFTRPVAKQIPAVQPQITPVMLYAVGDSRSAREARSIGQMNQ